jgi:putative oxidoreductase
MIDHTQAIRAERGLVVLRLALASLLLVHGIARVVNGVAPFGEFLDSQGIPLGIGVAWFVTVYELLATWIIAFGPKRLLPPVCLVFVAIYAFGIWLVHWPAGWFVVGAGRNGSEYSALLIVALLMFAWIYWPAFRGRR